MRTRAKPCDSIDLLVVDDDPITRLGLRQLFEEEGYHCAEAEDGEEAVAIARQAPPRVILLDLMMPRLDGFGVARELRSDPLTRGVRILFLTGREDQAARSAARRAGGELLLTKPFDLDGILDVVRTVLSSRGARSQAQGS